MPAEEMEDNREDSGMWEEPGDEDGGEEGVEEKSDDEEMWQSPGKELEDREEGEVGSRDGGGEGGVRYRGSCEGLCGGVGRFEGVTGECWLVRLLLQLSCRCCLSLLSHCPPPGVTVTA